MLILSFAKIGAWPHVWEPLASRGNPMLPKTDKTLSGEKDIRSLMHHCCNALKWLLVQWQQKQWSLIRCIVCPYCACCWCALNTKLHTVEKRVESNDPQWRRVLEQQRTVLFMDGNSNSNISDMFQLHCCSEHGLPTAAHWSTSGKAAECSLRGSFL